MKKAFVLLAIVTMLLQACSTSDTTPTTSAPVNATEAVVVTAVSEPDATETVVPEAATSEPIVHTTIPTGGTTDRASAHDNDNASTFERKVVRSGDEFFRNRFERPFTANEMEYLPDLDIVNFSITSDDAFFYIKISLVGLDAATQSLTGSYGVEIDGNADGRAEILLATRPPYTNEFTAENVSVYLDINSDVGGSNINRPDNFEGDGFETVIFDLNQGVYPEGDPDLAWVRLTADGALPAVEIAYKKWIFGGGNEKFMWSVDSSSSPLNPTILYYQDSFTAEEAGAANSEDPNYPIKALAEMDNTCRVPLGFQATGNEPLGCLLNNDVENRDNPSDQGAESTCGQFGELCSRTEGRTVFFDN